MGTRPRHDAPGRWISMLYRFSQSHLARKLEPHRIGHGQIGFLLRLYRGEGLTQDDLASLLFIDKGTTARALLGLERNGYIERRRDIADGRVKRVYLTAKAWEIRPVLREVLGEWTETLFDGFPPEERRAMLESLERMAANAASALREERERPETHPAAR